MQIYHRMSVVIAIIAVLASCTTPYTNKDLQSIFNAKGLETTEREQGVIIFLPGVFFDVDKADLTMPAQMKIKDMATVLVDPRVIERNLLVEGHTDSTGADEYNLDLSNRRARSVYSGLVDGKVDAKRMKIRGYGEKYPIADNTYPDGRPNSDGQARNRRVEVVVKNLE